MAQYSIELMKSYSNGGTYCLKSETSSRFVSSIEYSSCHFVPNSDYPTITLESGTGSSWWSDANYDLVVKRTEYLFFDILFGVLIIWSLLGLFKFTKNLFFK